MQTARMVISKQAGGQKNTRIDAMQRTLLNEGASIKKIISSEEDQITKKVSTGLTPIFGTV